MNIFKSRHQSVVKECFIQSVITFRLIVDHICKNKYPDPDNQHKWTGLGHTWGGRAGGTPRNWLLII